MKPKTIFCDIDGTLIEHLGSLTEQYKNNPKIIEGTIEKINEWDVKGYNIILTTGRRESMRNQTEKMLEDYGIFYDKLIMGIGGGCRVIINDLKPNNNTPTAESICLNRNEGIKNVSI